MAVHNEKVELLRVHRFNEAEHCGWMDGHELGQMSRAISQWWTGVVSSSYSRSFAKEMCSSIPQAEYHGIFSVGAELMCVGERLAMLGHICDVSESYRSTRRCTRSQTHSDKVPVGTTEGTPRKYRAGQEQSSRPRLEAFAV